MKRILLTGASGTVGKEVLRQLCNSGEDLEVTVFDIRNRHSELLLSRFRKKIRIVYGDISGKRDISEACKNQDIIIHLAAIIPPAADRYPQLAWEVNVNGTRNLVSALEEWSPGAFLIYSSSISVYGDRISDPWIKVTDKLIPSDRDEYARTKIEAERIIRAGKIRWTIFRLTAIMGIDNHKPTPLMFHMPLETKMEIATPEDTARAIVNALDKSDILDGNTYNLSGGENCRISYKDFLSRSFRIIGLGELDFEKGAFATRNFHCGYYEDGDILDDILHFRSDSIDDYFMDLRKSTSVIRRLITSLFKGPIKNSMLKNSEPLAAIKSENETELKHYFSDEKV
jgi:nucleoside-diphosphate-sugar epimerase